MFHIGFRTETKKCAKKLESNLPFRIFSQRCLFRGVNHGTRSFYFPFLVTLFFLMILGFPGWSQAEEEATAPSESSKEKQDEILDEDDCSLLFGSEELEKENEQHREKRLEHVMESNGIITIMHHSKQWSEATHGMCEGIELETIEKDENGEYLAIFEVGEDIAEMYDCEPGLYEVSQDASIFSQAAVLWIDKRFVLLGYEGELTYLTPDPENRYIVRMIWQSPWTISRPKEPSRSRSNSRRSRRHRKSRRRRR